jgi:hypothetical protein
LLFKKSFIIPKRLSEVVNLIGTENTIARSKRSKRNTNTTKNPVRASRFWNDLHQVRLKSKD